MWGKGHERIGKSVPASGTDSYVAQPYWKQRFLAASSTILLLLLLS